jgi:hypothetical protein
MSKTQLLQSRSVTRLGAMEIGCRSTSRTSLNAAYETAWVTGPTLHQLVPRLQTPQRRSQYIRATANWRRAEDMLLSPCGPIGIRSRAGALARLTLQLAESGDPASQRRTAQRLSKTRRALPVHFPKWRMTEGLHPSASRRPSVFKAAPARVSGSSSMATTIGLGPTFLRFRKPLLVQLSYVVMVGSRRNGHRIISRARNPSTDSPSRTRAGSSAGNAVGPP